ncbi:hypothetical protein Anapl_00150 [Anas platyrhynchos]|uniref:Uncharacterized protein n=1 Tax=Anas platyrhynchos TaxID=8839 RepID=R0K3B7_ANAPL|nr:hypothetical protein Anapl_00150 [Anas platyrhynchos]
MPSSSSSNFKKSCTHLVTTSAALYPWTTYQKNNSEAPFLHNYSSPMSAEEINLNASSWLTALRRFSKVIRSTDANSTSDL